MKIVEGKIDAEGLRIGLVVSRFNGMITDRLLEGALEALRRAGASEDDLVVVRVPGSFELPLAAQRLATQAEVEAVVCLGAVIRGETPHFDYICQQVTRGLGEVALATGVPVAYGVLTTDTVEQALDRSGLKQGNKGVEAALSAVEMARLLASLNRAG